MNNQDILLQLSSRLDNSSLELLSKTPLWETIRLFAQQQYFWYLRTQHLVNRELKQQPEDWKKTYYLLSSVLRTSNPFTLEVLSDRLSVEILLELGYNPSVSNDYAIRNASRYGHTEVVRLLLTDPRIDPTAKDNEAIEYASADGYTEVVKLLLQDGRADPSVNDNWSIIHSSRYGHTEVVKLLLADSRVDPTAGDNYAIRSASLNEQTEVVKLLLADLRVNSSITNHDYLIGLHSKYGHTEVIKLLK